MGFPRKGSQGGGHYGSLYLSGQLVYLIVFAILYRGLRYNFPMKKSLLEINPYLKNPEQRKRLLRRSLISSFAIEGIEFKDEGASVVKEETANFTSYKTSTSDR